MSTTLSKPYATQHLRAAVVSILPKYAPIPKAIELLGLSRSSIYRMAGAGQLRFVKAGGRSLVDLDHAFAFMASLPTAPISRAR